MAPTCPEEIDVFSIPHSRMKELVQKYLDMLTATNFSDVLHLTNLLGSLSNMFGEFKAHEQIENRFIMKKLREKLRALSIENTAVCNCHSDNRLTDMMNLLQDGYKCTKKTEAERKNYGMQLQNALEEFTEKFIPHMTEEEEVFQPLLMKYFTFEELRDIKSNVLQQHCLRADEGVVKEEKFVEDYVTCESSEDDYIDSPPLISILPDEVILKIFGCLSPRDLCRCAQISTQWNLIALDVSLWSSVCPVQWAKGNWSFDVMEVDDECEEGVHVMEQILKRVKLDEDADIDESEDSDSSDSGDLEVRQVRYEANMLAGIVKYLLPRVGVAVKKCDLSYSRGITNGVLYKILSQCPNLEYLSLTQTRISDIGFKGLACAGFQSRLKHVELSGCINVTDLTLQRLSSALNNKCFQNSEQKTPSETEVFDKTASKNKNGCKKNHKKLEETTLLRHCKRKTGKNVKKQKFVKTCARRQTDCCGKCDRYSASSMVGSVSCDNKKLDIGRLTSSQHQTWTPHGMESQEDLLVCDWLNCSHMVQDAMVPNVCDTNLNSEQRMFVGECDEKSDLGSVVIDVTVTKQFEGTMNERTFDLSDSRSAGAQDNTNPCVRGLEYLSLSGCYRITDLGLSALAKEGGLPNLTYLDVSGCMNVTNVGLCELVSTCSHLNQAHLFYCDNIVDGPFAGEANGCQNLQSSTRVCCRSGE